MSTSFAGLGTISGRSPLSLAEIIDDSLSAGDVIEQLRSMDETGDEEFVGSLIETIQQEPDWWLVELPAAGPWAYYADDRTVDEYVEVDGASFPPIIAMLEEPTRTAWQPLDGGHRVAAAIKRGDSTIRALVPAQERGR